MIISASVSEFRLERRLILLRRSATRNRIILILITNHLSLINFSFCLFNNHLIISLMQETSFDIENDSTILDCVDYQDAEFTELPTPILSRTDSCIHFKPNDTFDVSFVPTVDGMKYHCTFKQSTWLMYPPESNEVHILCDCVSCLKLDLADRVCIPFYALRHEGTTFINTTTVELYNNID